MSFSQKELTSGRVKSIRSLSIYFFMGTLVWITIDASGIHSTVTGIIFGL